jgi:hypothetical protein
MSDHCHWVEDLVKAAGAIAPAAVEGKTFSYCCVKHELEYAPKKLELYEISIRWKPYHNVEKSLKVLYNRAKRIGKGYKVVHFIGNPNGFLLAVTPIKTKLEKNLNVQV